MRKNNPSHNRSRRSVDYDFDRETLTDNTLLKIDNKKLKHYNKGIKRYALIVSIMFLVSVMTIVYLVVK